MKLSLMFYVDYTNEKLFLMHINYLLSQILKQIKFQIKLI